MTLDQRAGGLRGQVGQNRTLEIPEANIGSFVSSNGIIASAAQVSLCTPGSVVARNLVIRE